MRKIFLENPYDVETILESLRIASSENKEMIYLDRLIATLRINSEGDLTNINYRILNDLRLLKLEQVEN